MPWPPETLRWSSPAHTPPPPAGSSPGSWRSAFPRSMSRWSPEAGRRTPACWSPEVRLYLLHRQPGGGPGGPAPRRSVPHAGHPGAGRKEPLHRGRDCGSEADRPAHLSLENTSTAARPAWPPTISSARRASRTPCWRRSSGRSLSSSAPPPWTAPATGRSSTRSTSSDCWG